MGTITDYISEINNALVDNLDVVRSMHILIEHGDNCSETCGSS